MKDRHLDLGDLPTILLELDESGNMTKTYVYANGQILAQHDGPHTAAKYFYLHDRLGSVRQVIDTSGNVKNCYTYQPFGELFAMETTENVPNPFKFTGQYYDSEISEYYLRARQYDPHIGRFTSRDPIKGKYKEPLTLHQYLYCLNDPMNMIDPSGELSAASLVEPTMAGYSVHYAAIGFAAYGVATGNQRFLTLGISMEYMILPVMALAAARTSLDCYLDKWNSMLKDNQMGDLNLPPGTPKWVAIGIILSYLAWHLDGCLPDPSEELPSAKDWQGLRWERAPESSSEP